MRGIELKSAVSQVGRHGTSVRADEFGADVVFPKPFPQPVAPGAVALSAVRDESPVIMIRIGLGTFSPGSDGIAPNGCTRNQNATRSTVIKTTTAIPIGRPARSPNGHFIAVSSLFFVIAPSDILSAQQSCLFIRLRSFIIRRRLPHIFTGTATTMKAAGGLKQRSEVEPMLDLMFVQGTKVPRRGASIIRSTGLDTQMRGEKQATHRDCAEPHPNLADRQMRSFEWK